MEKVCDNHCSQCHTTCGQCHISRPTYHEGGLLKGHEVKKIASIGDTCIACHGARVADDYQGNNEGVEGSVHWLEEGMPCFECHNVNHYHGDGTEYAHRYAGPPGVSCLDPDCHPQAAPDQSEREEHKIHADKVACYVCHVSGPYKSCFSCHVALDEKGLPYYETEDSKLTFKIGRNPIKSDDRPWDYVLVRHVPVVPDSFAFYDGYVLPDFDNAPTWKHTTPHNIRRVTAQNESCDSCHGNADLFLTADDVTPEELEANADVIVKEEEIPPTSWGPYPVIEPTPVPGRWLWLLWVGLAIVAVVIVVVVVLVARRAKAG
jgi:thiosulfate/3-mercaptopyruvate sulfurtransferase